MRCLLFIFFFICVGLQPTHAEVSKADLLKHLLTGQTTLARVGDSVYEVFTSYAGWLEHYKKLYEKQTGFCQRDAKDVDEFKAVQKDLITNIETVLGETVRLVPGDVDDVISRTLKNKNISIHRVYKVIIEKKKGKMIMLTQDLNGENEELMSMTKKKSGFKKLLLDKLYIKLGTRQFAYLYEYQMHNFLRTTRD